MDGARLTIRSQGLPLLHKVHKVLLLLICPGREALLDGGVDGKLDVAALLLALRDGLFSLSTCQSAFLASQVLAEIGVCAALMVEVESIGYERERGLWSAVGLASRLPQKNIPRKNGSGVVSKEARRHFDNHRARMGYEWARGREATEGRQRGDDITYPIGPPLLWQRILLRRYWAGPSWRSKDEN